MISTIRFWMQEPGASAVRLTTDFIQLTNVNGEAVRTRAPGLSEILCPSVCQSHRDGELSESVDHERGAPCQSGTV